MNLNRLSEKDKTDLGNFYKKVKHILNNGVIETFELLEVKDNIEQYEKAGFWKRLFTRVHNKSTSVRDLISFLERCEFYVENKKAVDEYEKEFIGL